jgi:hypothetical protein
VSSKKVLDQLDAWRKELVNLNRTNRLLYFRHTKTSTLELAGRSPDDLLQGLESASRPGWGFQVSTEPGSLRSQHVLSDKADVKAQDNALKALERRATQEYLDKGLWILYVAFGMLVWKDPQDIREATSPLVLVPVTLGRDSPRDPYRLKRAEEDLVVNPALEVKLRQDFGYELPGLDVVENGTLAGYFADVKAALPGLEARVEPRAVLAPFSFHKEVMFRDLLENAEQIAEHPVVNALADPKSSAGERLAFDPIPDERLDVEAPAEEMASVLPADASQRRCIAAAKAGRSFVMDGPPGTGKSQTITNIIAEVLRDGRTVLFVSEKAAALEVVRSRLAAAGLGEYVLELHSHKATRKEVAQELGRSLQHRTVPGVELPPADRRAAQRHREELNAYAAAMNEARPGAGRSLHATLGRIEQLADTVALTPPRSFAATMTEDDLRAALEQAGFLSRAWGPVDRGDDFLWRDALPQRPRLRLIPDLRSALEALRQDDAAVADQTRLPRRGGVAALRQALPLLERLAEPPQIPSEWLSRESLIPVEETVAALERAQAEHAGLTSSLVSRVGAGFAAVEGDREPVLAAALDSLHAAGVQTPEVMTLAAADVNAAFFRDSVAHVDALYQRLLRVADALGLDAADATVDRARQLCELAALSGASHRPEPQWLDPQVQDALQRAAAVLGQLVEEYRSREAAVSDIFTPAVLDLDLEVLEQRFQHVHKGFRKWGGAYRADKRMLSDATRSGKANKHVRARLGEARDWQSLTRRLQEAEGEHAGVIGEQYYRRAETDFGAVVDAVEVARRAVQLVGREAGTKGVVDRLARGGAQDASLAQEAQQLLQDLDQWAAQCEAMLAGPTPVRPLRTLSAWCGQASGLLVTVATQIKHVSDVAGSAFDLGSTVAALGARSQMQIIEAAFAPEAPAVRALLGGGYAGVVTDMTRLGNDLHWARDVRSLLGSPVRSRVAEQLLVAFPDAQAVTADLARHDKLLGELLSHLAPLRHAQLTAELGASFEDALDLLDELERSVGDIDEWTAYVEAQNALKSLGLGELLDELVELAPPAGAVVAGVERATLQAHVDHLLHTDPRLATSRSADRDHLVEQFRQLDERVLHTAAASVVTSLNNRRPRTTTGVAGTIQREAQKKTRHMPVRQLLAETAPVTQRLKPCFMMSPLTVSQFLTSELSFDVVIFDEASQVLPADAVNCIYRGQQVIVAGDQKQLPPTSFFMGGAEDEDDDAYDDEQLDEFESVLDLCKGSGGFPSLPLLWHYRSQHESLITYSNYSFYDGELISFPGAVVAAPDVGVALIDVPDGTYRRGGPRDNPREAAVVVDRVLDHAQRHPELSCGVVAFSEAQAAAIEIELERRRKTLPGLDSYFAEDRLNGFFVKNLETVQGDERDIIIFSIGYGPDENGKITMNFGPVNRKGGWRRLNVAATRAKRRVEVVASLGAADIQSTNESVLHLKRYLDYASRGVAALSVDLTESQGDYDSPFEEEVARVISSWGYDVVPQVGSAGYRIDMAVRHPERPGAFALGIECDGVMYHSSKVARDRDRLREGVLRGLGWELHRIWGTAWYRDRAREEERLHEAIRASFRGTGRSSQSAPPVSAHRTIPVEVEQVDLDEAPEWAQLYVVSQPMARRGLLITDPAAAAETVRVVVEAVTQEGPIHVERLIKRARIAFDVGRTGSKVRIAIEDAIARLVRERRIEQHGDFYALPGSFPGPVRVPDAELEESRRKVEEVPAAELALALRLYVFDAHAIDAESLFVAIARLYGWGRVGQDIRNALEDSLDDLISQGLLREVGSSLVPG